MERLEASRTCALTHAWRGSAHSRLMLRARCIVPTLDFQRRLLAVLALRTSQ
jgi:hypothetical protein